MKITRRTHILFIALLIVVVFSPSLKNDFAWDDKYLITNNPYAKNWAYLPQIFTTQLYQGSQVESNFYRPMQLISFAVDHSIWGLNPFGYHLTNLALHVFNSVLVYFILIAISASPYLALLTAMFFGISPAISGITYYISARSDLLMALFMFLSFLLFGRYVKTKGRALYIFSVVSFMIALLCKEMAVALLMFLGLEILRSGEKKSRQWPALLPYVIVMFFYGAIRYFILDFSGNADPSYTAHIPLWGRILTDFKIVPKYLGLLLFPYGLHMEWFIEPAKRIFETKVLFSFGLIVALAFMLRRLWRANKLVLFGVLWFLLGLAPVLNIYPISVFFGEGWLYVPSVGFFIVLGIIFQDVIAPRAGRVLTRALVALLLVYYSFFTISYGKVWKDSVSLFENVLKYEKKSPFIHLTYNNMAMAYYDKGEIAESIEHCRNSISSNPRYPEAYNNLGVAYMAEARPVRAMANFKKAISLKKDYTSAYCNLAHAYKGMGMTDNAIRFSMAAIDIDPDSYDAYRNLGYIFSEKGDADKAIRFFTKAREIRRESFEPYYCLGNLYIRKNRYKAALGEFQEALRRGAGDYKFYNELAFLYIKNNRFKEAEGALMQSLELNSDQSEPHNNLGNLYSMLGYLDLAIDEYRMALELEPDNAEMQDNLRKTEVELTQHP